MGGREVVLPEPHPSTTMSWIAPMEVMGRASVGTSAGGRQEQSEGQKRRYVASTDYNNQQYLKGSSAIPSNTAEAQVLWQVHSSKN